MVVEGIMSSPFFVLKIEVFMSVVKTMDIFLKSSMAILASLWKRENSVCFADEQTS